MWAITGANQTVGGGNLRLHWSVPGISDRLKDLSWLALRPLHNCSVPGVDLASRSQDSAYTSSAVTDILEVQERLGRLFETAFRAEDIAESLVSFDAERLAGDISPVLARTRFKVAGVREDGKITGYVKASELEGDATCGDLRRDFNESDVVAGQTPLADAIQASEAFRGLAPVAGE